MAVFAQKKATQKDTLADPESANVEPMTIKNGAVKNEQFDYPYVASQNAISWQENTHQQRSTVRFLARKWLGLLLIIAIILTVVLTLTQLDFPTRELAIYTIWLVHVATAIRAIVAGANVISREHVGQTWDSLVLTDVTPRQLLMGKWRAALDQSAAWMLGLGTIRLAMLPVFLYAMTQLYGWTVSVTYGYSGVSSRGYAYITDQIGDVTWVPWAAVLAVVSCVVLTILEVMACTALGVACSAIARRGSVSTIVALGIRFSLVALFVGFMRFDLKDASGDSYRVLRYAPFAIADAGTAPISRLMVPVIPWSYTPTFSTHVDALGGLALACIALTLLLLISLAVAWVAIRHSGVLPRKRV